MLPDSVLAGDFLCADMAKKTEGVAGNRANHRTDAKNNGRMEETGVGWEIGKEMK